MRLSQSRMTKRKEKKINKLPSQSPKSIHAKIKICVVKHTTVTHKKGEKINTQWKKGIMKYCTIYFTRFQELRQPDFSNLPKNYPKTQFGKNKISPRTAFRSQNRSNFLKAQIKES